MKPKAGYDLATAAHFDGESSTDTRVNVCTTDFTKSVEEAEPRWTYV